MRVPALTLLALPLLGASHVLRHDVPQGALERRGGPLASSPIARDLRSADADDRLVRRLLAEEAGDGAADLLTGLLQRRMLPLKRPTMGSLARGLQVAGRFQKAGLRTVSATDPARLHSTPTERKKGRRIIRQWNNHITAQGKHVDSDAKIR